MGGLSQLELDALCCSAPASDDECPPSPQDSCLKKRGRRVTLSAMTAEIAALEEACPEGLPGISQKELDNLAVAEEGGALR
eukprot:CAMPEP_0115125832 /NCGR_PEP_ID=MMETSP0227-20121206/49306_1 /TAXON_ID=89957 /ORGANISM="Polarella glacialis, Strain CCMP 1383" /LENGTH=80 /DNA_ID=CAMNT_0002529337 /DNA_START=44 /DNA_END=282 /DNA_ORIENTATION=-